MANDKYICELCDAEDFESLPRYKCEYKDAAKASDLLNMPISEDTLLTPAEFDFLNSLDLVERWQRASVCSVCGQEARGMYISELEEEDE